MSPTIQNPSRCRNSLAPTDTEQRPGPVGSIKLTESQFCFPSSLERHETRQAAALATAVGERITRATVTPRPHDFDLKHDPVKRKRVKRLGNTYGSDLAIFAEEVAKSVLCHRFWKVRNEEICCLFSICSVFKRESRFEMLTSGSPRS